MYLWLQKVSKQLVFTKNWVKLHQTRCKHKLNVFLSKIEYADNHHIWKLLRCLAFSDVNKMQGVKIFFWSKTMCIAENYLKNYRGSYFEWSDLMLALWRKEPGKCRVFQLFALNKLKLRQNEIFATKIPPQSKHQIT